MHYAFTTYFEIDNKHVIIRRVPSDLKKKIVRQSYSFYSNNEASDYFNKLREKLEANGYKIAIKEEGCFRINHEAALLLGMKKPTVKAKAMAARKR